jgi:hypothetical protein
VQCSHSIWSTRQGNSVNDVQEIAHMRMGISIENTQQFSSSNFMVSQCAIRCEQRCTGIQIASAQCSACLCSGSIVYENHEVFTYKVTHTSYIR